MKRRALVILGSTGSIGRNALKVYELSNERFEIIALSARGSKLSTLAAQIERYRPRCVALENIARARALRARLNGASARSVEILHGADALEEIASMAGSDGSLVNAIVGSAGLAPTMAAIRAGSRIALANKESLVIAGRALMSSAARYGASIVPIDSEHSAIFQALIGSARSDVRRLILTASGGPFRDWPLDRFDAITPKEALAHPKWRMGKKISIDSATMMNKGLEMIEARWLFDIAPERIEIVVHPESVAHSLVEFSDRSILAQLGPTDMLAPIAYALSYPDRMELPLQPLDLVKLGRLTFEKPDNRRFPLLKLARAALEDESGALAAMMNGANEGAVEAFLAGSIKFTDIAKIVRRASVATDETAPVDSAQRAIKLDRAAHRRAKTMAREMARAAKPEPRAVSAE